MIENSTPLDKRNNPNVDFFAETVKLDADLTVNRNTLTDNRNSLDLADFSESRDLDESL